MNIMGGSLSWAQLAADAKGIGAGKKDGVATKEELTALSKSDDLSKAEKKSVATLVKDFDKINTGDKKKGLTAAEVHEYESDLRKSQINPPSTDLPPMMGEGSSPKGATPARPKPEPSQMWV